MLINPVIKVPEKAADAEIINVITEIQIFIQTVIFIPRILYAILAPILSTLFANEINNIEINWFITLLDLTILKIQKMFNSVMLYFHQQIRKLFSRCRK